MERNTSMEPILQKCLECGVTKESRDTHSQTVREIFPMELFGRPIVGILLIDYILILYTYIATNKFISKLEELLGIPADVSDDDINVKRTHIHIYRTVSYFSFL